MTRPKQDKERAAAVLRCAADEINRFGLYRGAIWANAQEWDPLREPPPSGPCCTGGALYKAHLAIGAGDAPTLFAAFIERRDIGNWSDAQDADGVVQALLEAAQLIEEGNLWQDYKIAI